MIETPQSVKIVIHDAYAAYELNNVLLPSTGFSTKWLSNILKERFNVSAFLLHDGGITIGKSGNPIFVEALSDLPKTLLKAKDWSLPINVRPWQRLGWVGLVNAWISSRWLYNVDEDIEIELVSTYDLACVLRVQKNKTVAYFKATETLDETKITVCLASQYPKLIPQVLAYDFDRTWLLSLEEGCRLSEVNDLNAWKQAVIQLTHFHQNTQPEVFANLTIPVFNFDSLVKDSIEFITSKDTLVNWGILEDKQIELIELIPRFQKAHASILTLRLKECYCHGDAQPMNALWKSDASKWFDWSETCIAHPFTDIGWMLAWLIPKRPNLALEIKEDVISQLWDSYIKEIKVPQASHLMVDAMIVALMHRILAYHRKYYLWQGTIPEWKPQYVPYYIRLLCKISKLKNS